MRVAPFGGPLCFGVAFSWAIADAARYGHAPPCATPVPTPAGIVLGVARVVRPAAQDDEACYPGYGQSARITRCAVRPVTPDEWRSPGSGALSPSKARHLTRSRQRSSRDRLATNSSNSRSLAGRDLGHSSCIYPAPPRDPLLACDPLAPARRPGPYGSGP